jgi:hypothetical protein
MKKIILGLIILLIILCAVAVGLNFLKPNYKTFNDENIQVEIPNEIYFTVNSSVDDYGKILSYVYNKPVDESNLSIFEIIHRLIDSDYEKVEPFASINIVSIDSNTSNASESYNISKKSLENDFKNYTKINRSEYNYTGIIYDGTDYEPYNHQDFPSVYTIILFDDTKQTITILSSDNIDTVIKMAETFNLKIS